MKRILLLAALVCFSLTIKGQVPQLVKNLQPGSLMAYEQPAAYNGKLIFVLDSGLGASFVPQQVWISDGTASGTQKIKSFASLGLSGGFTLFNNKIYFVGNDGVKGRQLWVTQGTAANTYIVTDIQGPGWVDPHLTVLNGKLYFPANDFDHGDELWVSDGTAAGTHIVMDIRPGQGHGLPEDAMVAANNSLFFSANDGTHGEELWMSDGTAGNTHMITDLSPGNSGSDVRDLFAVKDKVYFREYMYTYPQTTPPRNTFCVTNGSAAGTTVLNDSILFITDYAALNDKVYFFALHNVGVNNSGKAKGLWVSDGTVSGTRLVKDSIGYDGCTQSLYVTSYLTAFNNRLYFSSSDGPNPPHTNQLWISNGTTTGTRILKDFEPGSANSSGYFPTSLTVIDNTLYFKAWDNESNRVNIWKSDGTDTGTHVVRYPGAFNHNNNICLELQSPIIRVDSFIYFALTYDSSSTGLQLNKLRIDSARPADSLTGPSFTIFPNPASGSFSISCDVLAPVNADIEIMTIEGKKLQQLARDQLINKGHSVFTYPVGALASGMYLVSIQTPDGIWVQKLIMMQ